MSREIKLDGGEITVLKQIGISGAHVNGKVLLEHADGMMPAEFLDTLQGLMSLGYVLANRVSIRTVDDVERATFQVNPSYARDLKEALHPQRHPREERRSRRERRG